MPKRLALSLTVALLFGDLQNPLLYIIFQINTLLRIRLLLDVYADLSAIRIAEDKAKVIFSARKACAKLHGKRAIFFQGKIIQLIESL